MAVVVVAAGFIAMATIVAVGWAAISALRGDPGSKVEPSRGTLALDFGLGMVAALVGGATTGWLAAAHPLHHALALAGLVLAMAVLCIVKTDDKGLPRWYQAVLSLSSAVAVVAAAWLIEARS